MTDGEQRDLLRRLRSNAYRYMCDSATIIENYNLTPATRIQVCESVIRYLFGCIEHFDIAIQQSRSGQRLFDSIFINSNPNTNELIDQIIKERMPANILEEQFGDLLKENFKNSGGEFKNKPNIFEREFMGEFKKTEVPKFSLDVFNEKDFFIMVGEVDPIEKEKLLEEIIMSRVLDKFTNVINFTFKFTYETLLTAHITTFSVNETQVKVRMTPSLNSVIYVYIRKDVFKFIMDFSSDLQEQVSKLEGRENVSDK